MSKNDEVTVTDLFATKLPEITQDGGYWVIHCSVCKMEFKTCFAVGFSEWAAPVALEGRGWQLTKKGGKVCILCPDCKGGRQ